MTTFRLKAEFTIEVFDALAAREAAKQFLIDQVDSATMRGETVTTGNSLAAKAIEDILVSPQALSSLLATAAFKSGANHFPMASISRLTMEHLPSN